MNRIKEGQRVAGVVTLITVVLAVLKALVGYLTGTIVLIADSVHSGADVLAIFASWFGLKLSIRPPNKRFPYGFYKAETIATLFISGLIIYAGIILFVEGGKKFLAIPQVNISWLAIGVSLISAFLAYIFSRWEKRVGLEINSASLIANSDESKINVITSLMVFCSIILTSLGLPYIEGGLTILISVLILWIGLKNGRIAIYGLMDASLNPKLEEKIGAIANSISGVYKTANLRVRQAGPFVFGQLHIKINKSLDINRGHEIAHKVEEEIKLKLPEIDSISTHIEPYETKMPKLMIPVKDNNGLNSKVSGHFGRAEYFLFVQLNQDEIKEFYIRKNEFKKQKIRAGLDVVNHFVKEEINVLVTKEIGEIGFHTLRDNFIDIYQTKGTTGRDVAENFITKKLKKITFPTCKGDEVEFSALKKF